MGSGEHLTTFFKEFSYWGFNLKNIRESFVNSSPPPRLPACRKFLQISYFQVLNPDIRTCPDSIRKAVFRLPTCQIWLTIGVE